MQNRVWCAYQIRHGAKRSAVLATGMTGGPNCRNDPDMYRRRSLRDSNFRPDFPTKPQLAPFAARGLCCGHGSALAPCRRDRYPPREIGRPRTTRKSREKRPPREITGPNRRFLDGRHGNYSARTCSSSPRPEKIKHRAALARRQAKGGPPERQKFHLILLKILNLL